MKHRIIALTLAVVLALGAGAAPVSANQAFPEVIDLPGGFFPEGIAIGTGPAFFTGSLIDGAIYRGDLRTGEGAVLVEGQEGLLAVGMDVDRTGRLLFVAGGPTGTARIYNTSDGALVDDVAIGAGFVNDVIVTRQAAYFTNSFAPELYELPLDNRGRVNGPVRTIALSGDFQFVPGQFNANGIEAPNRDTLIIVNSNVGELYTVDIATGATAVIDTGGEVLNGDGLVLVGRTLFVVVGGTNEVKKLRLTPGLRRAQVIETITNDVFETPTTAATNGRDLYVVSAKFNIPPLPTTPYEVVKVDR